MDRTGVGSVVSMRERVAGLASEFARMRTADVDSLSAADLLHVRTSLSVMRRDLDILDHKIVAAAARKDAHTSAGATSMISLISATSGVTKRQAAQTIKLAEKLEDSPVLASHMAKPGMSPVKAHMITDALDRLPADITSGQRAQIEKQLVEAAPVMSVEQFRRQCKRAIEHVDVKRANQIENDELITNEATALRAASFWMSRPDSAGMVKGGFDIDALTADTLRSILESKTAPRRLAITERNQNTRATTHAGNTTRDGKIVHAGAIAQAGATGTTQIAANQPTNTASTAGSASSISTAGSSVPVNYRETQGQAFIEILRRLPKDAYGNHGGLAATLMITVSEDSLRERSDAAGITEHGTPISASQLRHLACNAGILPAVLDSQSQILDLGRERRLHTPAQRKALAHRDDGCAFPDCDRPPGWCETHHIQAWTKGGETTINNGVLLCAHHHRHIHQSNWQIKLNPHDQKPDFYPPGTTTPKRNHRYKPIAA